MNFTNKNNVNDAAAAGWPKLGELSGKVICVLTGDWEAFKRVYNARSTRLCFADRAPSGNDDLHADGFVFTNFEIKKKVFSLIKAQ